MHPFEVSLFYRAITIAISPYLSHTWRPFDRSRPWERDQPVHLTRMDRVETRLSGVLALTAPTARAVLSRLGERGELGSRAW